jgi:hypothetical protein
MGQLYDIKSLYLWPILIVLFVLIFFVGGKASPDPGLLVAGTKYKRPLMALEQEPEAKEQLFKKWDDKTRKALRCALYWDFLFILIYPLAGVIGCLMAGRFLDSAHILSFRVSFVIILLQLVAGLFDVIENLILLRVIDGLTSTFWLSLARISTAGKFGLIGLGIIHALFGLLAWIYVTSRSLFRS